MSGSRWRNGSKPGSEQCSKWGVTVAVERAESPRSVVVGDEVGVTRRQ